MIEETLAMGLVGEAVATSVVDVTGWSLEELRTSDNAALVETILVLAGRAQCSQTGVLQNEFRDDN